jgi:hypothetical protein
MLQKINNVNSETARTVIIMGMLYTIYVWLTWGFIGVWWGDYGLWLHEVDRVASGQVPYKDFAWGYPPLSVYVYGIAARLIGKDISVLLTVSAVICLGIFVCYVAFIRALLDPSLVALVVVGTLLTSVAYSSIESETLAAGMYTPAAPLGGLLLLLAAFAYLRIYKRPHLSTVLSVGLLLALAILTKQDFWIPSVCVLGFSAFRVYQGRNGILLSGMLIFVFVGVIALGSVLAARAAGWENLLAGLGNYNVAPEKFGHSFVSWERIVGQVILLGCLSLCVVTCVKLANAKLTFSLTKTSYGLITGIVFFVAVYVVFTMGHVWPAVHSNASELNGPTGNFFAGVTATWPSLIGRSLSLLGHRLRLNGWPIFFAPIAFLWLITRWRSIADHNLRHLLLFLLCMSIAGRSRRLFEHIDWYNFLFEVPALLLAIKLALPAQAKSAYAANRNLAVIVLLAGIFSFVDWTLTPVLNLPVFNRSSWGKPKAVETAHGWVRLPQQDVRAFKEMVGLIDSIDPSGVAPIFSIGNQGPWAYYTGRRNPTPLTYGFRLWNQDPNLVLQKLLSEEPKPIVIREGAYQRRQFVDPQPKLVFNRWELIYQEYYHTRLDMPFYERLLAHYEAVGTVKGRLRSWTVYRWKPAPDAQQNSR